MTRAIELCLGCSRVRHQPTPRAPTRRHRQGRKLPAFRRVVRFDERGPGSRDAGAGPATEIAKALGAGGASVYRGWRPTIGSQRSGDAALSRRLLWSVPSDRRSKAVKCLGAPVLSATGYHDVYSLTAISQDSRQACTSGVSSERTPRPVKFWMQGEPQRDAASELRSLFTDPADSGTRGVHMPISIEERLNRIEAYLHKRYLSLKEKPRTSFEEMELLKEFGFDEPPKA